MIIFKGDRYHNALPYTKGHRHLVSPDKKKGLKMKNIFLYIYSKMIRVGRRIYKNGKYVDPVFEDYTNIVVMTASTKYGELSPYSLKNEDGVILENLWQFSKVYKNVPKSIQKYSRYDNTIIWSHDAEIHVDEKGDLTDQYWTWRDKGMKCVYPVRYPVNYNNRHLCLYCLFEDKDCYRELDYIEARKLLYVPEYIKSVKKEKKYRELLERLNKGENLLIIEVDGPHQESLDYYMKSYNVDKDFIVDDTILATDKNLDILLNDPKHPFGHGYCLALALLQNKN